MVSFIVLKSLQPHKIYAPRIGDEVGLLGITVYDDQISIVDNHCDAIWFYDSLLTADHL